MPITTILVAPKKFAAKTISVQATPATASATVAAANAAAAAAARPNFDTPDLASLGEVFNILPRVKAYTQTKKSQRMNLARQTVLKVAVERAWESLRIALTRMRSAYEASDLWENSANGYFLVQLKLAFGLDKNALDIEVRQLLQYFLPQFNRLLLGMQRSLELIDVPMSYQSPTNKVMGFVEKDGEERGFIHLDFSRVNVGQEWEVASTIIHEATHRFLHTKDHFYITTASIEKSGTEYSTLLKRENADSIAYFVIRYAEKELAVIAAAAKPMPVKTGPAMKTPAAAAKNPVASAATAAAK